MAVLCTSSALRRRKQAVFGPRVTVLVVSVSVVSLWCFVHPGYNDTTFSCYSTRSL